MPAPGFSWDDAAMADLRRYWSEGFTASEIADRMGKLSRCAVMGKVRRLNLERRAPGVRHASIKPRRQRAPQPRQKALPFIIRPFAKQAKSMPPLPLPRPAAADVARISYADFIDPSAKVDIPQTACRWPVGEPTRGFCGCDKVEGLSYCADHATRAFATPSTNRQSPQPTANNGINAVVAVQEFLAEATA